MATDFTHDSADYRAVFSDGTATFFQQQEVLVGTADSTETQYVPIVVQPFKTVNDGTRTVFADEADAVAWYKENY